MIAPQFGYPFYPPVNGLYQQPTPLPQQQPVQQQIRSGGIVSVSGEEEARRYPVAPGYTVTMRDDTGPYLYEKTMGFSQLEQPIFRKARIVFEDEVKSVKKEEPQQDPEDPKKTYAEISQLEALRSAVASDIQKLQQFIVSETSEIRQIIAATDQKRTTRKKEAEE